jgi:hypothetical protein
MSRSTFALAAGAMGTLAAVLVLALVASWGGDAHTALYQRYRWHTLRPDSVLRADADYGYSSKRAHGHGAKQVFDCVL